MMTAKTTKKDPVKKVNVVIKTVPVYETHSIVPLQVVYDFLGINSEKVIEAYIEEDDIRIDRQDALIIVEHVKKGEGVEEGKEIEE